MPGPGFAEGDSRSSSRHVSHSLHLSAPALCAQAFLARAQAWEVLPLTLDLGTVVGQPRASGLTKSFRFPWLSLLHLLPAPNPLIQMTAAGPAPVGLCRCRMFQPERDPFCRADCQWRLEEVQRLSQPSQRQDRERHHSGRGLSSVPH